MTAAAIPPAARLRALTVRDFRNLGQVMLDVPPNGFALIGDNGQGKTNLLEAIYYVQILRSIRGARDVDLVRFGAEGFHIAASVQRDTCHEVGVGFDRATKRKRVRVDGVAVDRLTDALGSLPSVMFSPHDGELIAGPPTERRRFLDIMLALTSPTYLNALQHYRAALLNRNAALRDFARRAASGSADEASIAVWEPPLARYGATLIQARRAWVDSSADRFASLCADIGEQRRMRLRYSATVHSEHDAVAALAAALVDKRRLDIRRGLTHAGPHRDDLLFGLDDRDLRTFGSAGQQRSAAMALRILEAATLGAYINAAPILLLDDPFAELDHRRSTRVLDVLTNTGLGQAILAVPRESDIPAELTSLERFHVSAGAVSPHHARHARHAAGSQ